MSIIFQGFANVYGQVLFARGLNFKALIPIFSAISADTPVARTVSRHGRNENATLATILTTIKFLALKIIWCRYNFPEIKSPELRFRRNPKSKLNPNFLRSYV
jgi:hypothetical protein